MYLLCIYVAGKAASLPLLRRLGDGVKRPFPLRTRASPSVIVALARLLARAGGPQSPGGGCLCVARLPGSLGHPLHLRGVNDLVRPAGLPGPDPRARQISQAAVDSPAGRV